MDGENPQQQVPQQPIQQPVTPKPSEEQSVENQQVSYSAPENNKDTKGVRKILNYISWTFLVLFLPITILIFLSQDSIPGDFFYPVKRSMENVILTVASASPATRAAFRTDLTTRRFDEAEKLLLASSGANGLRDFVTEIQAAQNEVAAISNPVKKQELQQKIQTSVTEYEKRLDVVKVKLVAQEEVNQLALVPTPSSTNTPVSIPTSTPQPPNLSKDLIVTPTILITATPIPSFTPIPTPTPSPTKEEDTIGKVDKVQDYLRCLQNTPPPHRECIAPEIKSANQSLEIKSEGADEKKLKRKEEQEERKKDLEERKEERQERKNEREGH